MRAMFKTILQAYIEIIRNMKLFVVLIVCTFSITIGVLAAFGFVPESPLLRDEVKASVHESEKPRVASYAVQTPEFPTHVKIASIGIDTPIVNPTTFDTNLLDAELQKGAVRYPGSAKLNENANIFLFGHSSGLPVVRNRAYKAFNNLGKAEIGDEVIVTSATHEYVYRVVSVSHKKDSEAYVTFSTGKKMLTLSTCNTFGKKQDRDIVEAEFIKSYPLESSQ